jgi:predicted molibdopterin-dependent oxidoreductase YjgC
MCILIKEEHRTEPIAREGERGKRRSARQEEPVMKAGVLVVVDGRSLRVAAGATLLAAAGKVSREISKLEACQTRCLQGCSGLCVVEVEGEAALVRACARIVERPIRLQTYSRRIRRERRRVLSALLAKSRGRCPTCAERSSCTLRALARDYDVTAPVARQPELRTRRRPRGSATRPAR